MGRSSDGFLPLGVELSRLRPVLGGTAGDVALLEGVLSDCSLLRLEEVFLRSGEVMDVLRTSADLEGTGGFEASSVGFSGDVAFLRLTFTSFLSVICSSATALILRAGIGDDLGTSDDFAGITGFETLMGFGDFAPFRFNFGSSLSALNSSTTALALEIEIRDDLGTSGDFECISGFWRSMTGSERMSIFFADTGGERTFSIEAFRSVTFSDVACSVE